MALVVGVDALHVLPVLFGVVGLILSEDLDYLAPRLVVLGLVASVALCPTDLDSSVFSYSSSSLRVMFTESSNSSITRCISSLVIVSILLLNLAEGVRFVDGFFAALLALNEVARVVL